jgi:hypothetical protein
MKKPNLLIEDLDQIRAGDIVAVIVASSIGIYSIVKQNGVDYQEHPVASISGCILGSVAAVSIFSLLKGWWRRRQQNQSSSCSRGGDLSQSISDEKIYAEVAHELEENKLSAGLWTKAYAKMGGDEPKTRALYIKYRFTQLSEVARQRDIDAARDSRTESANRPSE